jgi:hypothetical protein
MESDLRDLSGVNRRVGDVLARAVAGECPVDTGALASSWRSSGKRDAANAESSSDHALPVCFGARGRPPNRFDLRGTEAATADAVDTYDQELKKICRKAES